MEYIYPLRMILKVNIYRPEISLMLILLNENKQVIKRHDPIVLKTKAKPTLYV